MEKLGGLLFFYSSSNCSPLWNSEDACSFLIPLLLSRVKKEKTQGDMGSFLERWIGLVSCGPRGKPQSLDVRSVDVGTRQAEI